MAISFEWQATLDWQQHAKKRTQQWQANVHIKLNDSGKKSH